MKGKTSLTRKLALYCLLPVLALALTGCAAQYYDPGTQSAQVTVNLEAAFGQGRPWPPRGWAGRQVNWDWGLYLVDAGGNLHALAPTAGEQLRTIPAHDLKASATFRAPSGAVKLRLLASAWQHRMDGEGISLVTYADYANDYDLNLTPGATETINAKFGM